MSREDNIIWRFYSFIDLPDDPNGCWLWNGGHNGKGYGRFRFNYTRYKAHRFSYEYFYGYKIPQDMVTDHICRTRNCVRPDHLRIVTWEQNAVENSLSFSAINKEKKLCINGHEFINIKDRRKCKTCEKQSYIKYQTKKRIPRDQALRGAEEE